MKHKRNWIIGIALSATAGFLALQSVNAPTQNGEVEVASPTESFCAFTWATKDAPELTQQFDNAVKSLNPDASATVYFFGEDCNYMDGTPPKFGVMETDFTVRLPVDDLAKEEKFGDWVAQVMEIVLQLPEDEIQGKYGFVEFWFEKNDAEHITFRVPISEYQNEVQGKTGVELFRMYYSQP
jgi:hypothetical protein